MKLNTQHSLIVHYADWSLCLYKNKKRQINSPGKDQVKSFDEK